MNSEQEAAGSGADSNRDMRPFDVFMSYSKNDKLVADAICHHLEHSQIRCWIAPRDIVPGEEWGEGIIAGIDRSRLMVLVFSEHANASPQVRREVERAISKEIPVIPFRVENVKPAGALEFFLASTHWLDAYDPPTARHIHRLADTVNRLLAQDAKAAPKRDPANKRAQSSRFPKRFAYYILAGVGALLVILALVLHVNTSPPAGPNTSPPAGPDEATATFLRALIFEALKTSIEDQHKRSTGDQRPVGQ